MLRPVFVAFVLVIIGATATEARRINSNKAPTFRSRNQSIQQFTTIAGASGGARSEAVC
jgi:hypothetical protein